MSSMVTTLSRSLDQSQEQRKWEHADKEVITICHKSIMKLVHRMINNF